MRKSCHEAITITGDINIYIYIYILYILYIHIYIHLTVTTMTLWHLWQLTYLGHIIYDYTIYKSL